MPSARALPWGRAARAPAADPMRLLFVLPEYPPESGGGIATYYGALLPALVRQGHTVRALVGSAFTAGGASYELDGVRVERLESGRTERFMPAYARYAALPELQRHLAAARALWEQAQAGSAFDAVEVVDWGLLFAPWVAEAGPPALVQLHGSSGQIGEHDTYAGTELAAQTLRLLEASLLEHADALHTHSRANGAFWSAQTGRPVTVSPPPLPAVQAHPGPRGEMGFVAARLQEWKGPQVLAEALRRMGPDAPTVEWAGRVVAHPETGQPYDRRLRADFPGVWGHTLRPLGQMPPSEVVRKQATAGFVVVPSQWDVYNLSVAEAMQQGALVVCSDGAGGVDLIEDGRTGFRFPAGNAAALAETLARVRRAPEDDRSRIGAAAREAVSRELDPDAVARHAAARYAALRPLPAPPPWIASAVAPGPEADLDAFFRHLPLRTLLRHAAVRLREKSPFRRRGIDSTHEG